MCDVCVMQRVAGALGRRGMLAAAAAAATGLALSAAPAMAQAAARAVRSAPVARVVDLTHTLRMDFPTFGGTPAFELERVMTHARDGYNVNRFAYFEHVGTHFDAPIHFSADGATVDRIPVESLVCPWSCSTSAPGPRPRPTTRRRPRTSRGTRRRMARSRPAPAWR
jgi:hypothetical protein